MLLTVMIICLLLFPIAVNVGGYLAVFTSGICKKLRSYYYRLRLDRKKEENEELSCWQDPPEDVKEMIVKHMSLSGRVRLSSLCKSWRIASMRREIPTCPQLPWLVHPQPKTGDTLSFSSLSEGKVFKSRLPSCTDSKSMLKKLQGRTNKTSDFLKSSRGWLVMLEWEIYYRITVKREPVLYLVNPVSGAQHRLPPLQTIPSYKEMFADSLLRGGVVLSSTNVSKTMVAATLGAQKLILCRPRDKSWSTVFQVVDENDSEGCIINILFSSNGILYALVRDSNNCRGEVWIESRHLKFGDEEIKLKVIYEAERLIDVGLFMHERQRGRAYLTETTNNELLLIYQILDDTNVDEDVMEDNVVDEEGNNNNGEEDENNVEGNEANEGVPGWIGLILRKARHLKSFFSPEKPDIVDLRTSCFWVYKSEPDNSKFRKVQDIGDQIVFLAEDYSSLSIFASEFKEVQRNCIYFATRGRDYGSIYTSREIGIFYLASGRIERSFPSFEMTEGSRLSWFLPNLW